jgi:predicted pyridoxine 5'-phosphate oxidase superfamily flavin-nucleotide-binding protein
MATFFSFITDEQAELIQRSPVFFIATADPTSSDVADGPGPINLSPRGGTPLHIIDRNHVVFLDYAGSGNETARHALAGSPITVMVCSFEAENAAIVRLYGKAQITPLAESPLAEELLRVGARELKLPPRQVIEIQVEKTATSCGYGVPIMTFVSERRTSNRGRRYKTNRK